MSERRTCTALAVGHGAGSFLLVSLRDALLSGSLCSVRADGGRAEQVSAWYRLRFSWKDSNHGEALRVGVDDQDRIVAAETWLLPICNDSEKFGQLPSLLWRLKSARSVVGFRALEDDENGDIVAIEFELDTGHRLPFRHNWPVTCSSRGNHDSSPY